MVFPDLEMEADNCLITERSKWQLPLEGFGLDRFDGLDNLDLGNLNLRYFNYHYFHDLYLQDFGNHEDVRCSFGYGVCEQGD